MPAFYRHKIDRLRILQQLVRTARLTSRPSWAPEGTRLHQKPVGEQAGLAQSLVSELENLVTPKGIIRSVRRDDLVALLTWGLELSIPHINTLLWLADQPPLSSVDIRRYVRSYQPGATYQAEQQESDTGYRRHVLELLRASSASTYSAAGQQMASVQIFSADPRGRMSGEKALLEMEEIAGVVYLVGDNPHHLTHPPKWYEIPGNLHLDFGSPDLDQEFMKITSQRRYVFDSMLDTYGVRAIHGKASIEYYLTNRAPPKPDLDERRAHGRYLLELIKTRPLDIALVQDLPSVGLTMKSC